VSSYGWDAAGSPSAGKLPAVANTGAGCYQQETIHTGIFPGNDRSAHRLTVNGYLYDRAMLEEY